MKTMCVILIICGIFYMGVEVTNMAFLIKESASSQAELKNFQNEALNCPNNFGLMGCTNYNDAFPYKIKQVKYLCKGNYNYSDGADRIKYPKLLSDELKDNSRQWSVLYMLSYVLMTSVHVLILLFLVLFCTVFWYCCAGVEFLPALIATFIGLSKTRIHAIYLTGSLMSIFVILDFNKCIETEFGDDYRELYTEKSYGFAFFIMGLGLLPLYLTSCWAGCHYVHAVKSLRDNEIGALVAYLVFESLILIQQITLFVHWDQYYQKIPHTTNQLHNNYLFLSYSIEKSLIIFFWVYCWKFHPYPQPRIVPIVPQSSVRPLTDNQVSILSQLDSTFIVAEDDTTFHMIEENVKGGATCNICLDDMHKGDQISNLTCNHIFHHSCLKEWVKNNRLMQCPNCRSKIEPMDVEALSPTNSPQPKGASPPQVPLTFARGTEMSSPSRTPHNVSMSNIEDFLGNMEPSSEPQRGVINEGEHLSSINEVASSIRSDD